MRHDKIPVALIAMMFFTIGIMFCMNDILLPVVKDVFHLNYFEATSIQASFYIVYLLWPLLISKSIEKYGYRKNIIGSMIICIIGCLFFLPAYQLESFPLILLGVFIMSTGITVINVAANPYAALLGSPDGTHVRLNFVQAFSRIGYATTPIVASYLIYFMGKNNPQIHVPYLIVAILISIVIIFMVILKLPDFKPARSANKTLALGLFKECLQHKKLFFGIPVMFFYVGAESGTAGFFINYMTSHNQSTHSAATFLTFYYILAAFFALFGAFLLRFIKASILLSVFGIGMIPCYFIIIWGPSSIAPYALIGAGGFLSIMFPTVFGLSIENLNDFTERGSALLNFAIVGGAIFPPLQGWIADEWNISLSYIIPCLCIVVVTVYGIWISAIERSSIKYKT